MQFTQVAADAFQKLQMNAGVLVDSFNPATGVIGNIIGATTGGITFASNPTYEDFGEDVDNVPANTWQLKRIVSYDPVISGTLLTVSTSVVKKLIGGADISSTKITPRSQLASGDFADAWLVGDYSDNNSGAATAGYVAIHILKAFNTAGFQLTTTKNGKGQFAFEFHGHYDLTSIDTVPFEVYVKAGTSPATPFVEINTHSFTLANGSTQQLAATVNPAGTSITWSSSATGKATVSSAGLVTGAAAGTSIITASITVNSVAYTDTCTVVVT